MNRDRPQTKSRWLGTILFLASLAAAPYALGQPGHGDGGEHLGRVDFPVSCSAPARAEFSSAVAMLHHMTYPQARQAFRRVAELDPGCAMAHWGVAMTLFQPLWPTRPTADELRLGWEEAERAAALEPPTAAERLFVHAAQEFFREPESKDYRARLQRWEAATSALRAAYPHDPEVLAFWALAHLSVAPTDRVSLAHLEHAAAALLEVYAANPDHPGAMHYLIHANDVPGREHELLEVTRKYETVAPDNPHALHMPTHIYTRLGDWEAVVRGNLRAANAALRHPAGDAGELVWDEFPHAIEYLVYAYLQQGRDDEAAAQIARLNATAHLQPSFKTAFHLASTRARFALERHAWEEAAAIVPRQPPVVDWDRFAWPEAVSWFARGLGDAHRGELDRARAAVDRLEALDAATAAAGEDLFARNIRMLRLEVEAWLAQAGGEGDAAVALLQEAAELEAATPKHAVTPGPTLPAEEMLGDLWLEQHRPSDALAAYERCLERYPRRFDSLLGAARAARAADDEETAAARLRELREVAAGDGERWRAAAAELTPAGR